jgi:hypothetical protein
MNWIVYRRSALPHNGQWLPFPLVGGFPENQYSMLALDGFPHGSTNVDLRRDGPQQNS